MPPIGGFCRNACIRYNCVNRVIDWKFGKGREEDRCVVKYTTNVFEVTLALSCRARDVWNQNERFHAAKIYVLP